LTACSREWRIMQINHGHLALFVAFAINGTDAARAQNAIDKLQPLVETSARRLALAEQVALSKWDSKTPVEDPPREAQVVMGAVKAGESKGLDGTFVSTFFEAQIEANKTVQYSLLADWHRAGKAPAHAPVSLAGTVRPELDQLQAALIAALADTATIRANPTCRADIARAAGRYVSAHQNDSGPLQAIALDRALAAACTL
jgi:chorismate mutase